MTPTMNRPANRPADTVAEHRGRAMGTSVHVLVHGGPTNHLLGTALEAVRDLERRWSRFDPNSEVSEMNAASGRFVKVSPATIDLVVKATMAWHLTGGRFDPTIGRDLIELGYDRTFDEIDRRRDSAIRSDSTRRLGDKRRADCGGIEIDLDAGAVRLPSGVAFDPGGIGKGLAADRVTQILMSRNAKGALVNLGGDLRVRGVPFDATAWVVRIGEPSVRPEPFSTVALTEGAIATSTTRRRRWTDPTGRGAHHIIDPVTGDSRRGGHGGIVVASAIANDGWWAEAAATASIGPSPTATEAAPILSVETLRIAADGTEYRSDGFSTYER